MKNSVYWSSTRISHHNIFSCSQSTKQLRLDMFTVTNRWCHGWCEKGTKSFPLEKPTGGANHKLWNPIPTVIRWQGSFVTPSHPKWTIDHIRKGESFGKRGWRTVLLCIKVSYKSWGTLGSYIYYNKINRVSCLNPKTKDFANGLVFIFLHICPKLKSLCLFEKPRKLF